MSPLWCCGTTATADSVNIILMYAKMPYDFYSRPGMCARVRVKELVYKMKSTVTIIAPVSGASEGAWGGTTAVIARSSH